MLYRAAEAEAYIACLTELWYPKVVKNFEDEFKMMTDFAKERGMSIVPDDFL